MRIRRLLVAPLVIGVLAGSGIAAAASPEGVSGSTSRLQLHGEQQLTAEFGRGIARLPGGWIVSGPNALARVDEGLRLLRTVTPAIPAAWAARGYDRIGDVDVAGRYLYVPFEQPDVALGHQATARYDASTLRFIDAVELPQHENAFVTVDPATMVAYSMDRADDDALLRYDVRAGWRPLPPLGLGQTLPRVRGADEAAGSVWLASDDPAHTLFRVDDQSGAVEDLGAAGHTGGAVEGLDATRVGGARLHVMVVDPQQTPVWLTSFSVVGASATTSTPVEGTSGWPPILVMGALVLPVLGVGGSAVFVYRTWVGLRGGRRRS